MSKVSLKKGDSRLKENTEILLLNNKKTPWLLNLELRTTEDTENTEILLLNNNKLLGSFD